MELKIKSETKVSHRIRVLLKVDGDSLRVDDYRFSVENQYALTVGRARCIDRHFGGNSEKYKTLKSRS